MLPVSYINTSNLWCLQAFLPLVFPLFLGRLALWKKGSDSTEESESELNSPFELELFNFSE